eukprot:m.22386 g.22386  ORF g.22386 m.22386 type:complete len:736 (-) comp7394_c0_seq1:92-2299(-)
MWTCSKEKRQDPNNDNKPCIHCPSKPYRPGIDPLDIDVRHMGRASKQEAEIALRNAGSHQGDYVVRQSEQTRGAYGLTVSNSGTIQHYKIDIHNSQRTGRTKFGIQDGLRWEFLAELIEHYHLEEDGLCCLLLNNVSDEIPATELTLRDALGEGEFGTVLGGEWRKKDGSIIKVAVKCLKSELESDVRSFMDEGARMRFDHPNVVKLLGMSRRPPMKLVCELVPLGALNKFLKKEKATVQLMDQLEIIKQIAQGMEYLASKLVVHRDLAARNILVSTFKPSVLVKISDFGLSRGLSGDKQYYQSGRTGKWPLKWYAPECIYFSKFTSQSDVWSFGVTAWECLEKGKKPYRGLTGAQVVEYVHNEGDRLPPPTGCPSDMLELMLRCWEHDAHKRPTFSDIVVDMGKIIRSNSRNSTVSTDMTRARQIRPNYNPQAFYDFTPDKEELEREMAEEREYVNKPQARCNIKLNQLQIGAEIGVGSYGSVKKGMYTPPRGGAVQVAIKFLRVGLEFKEEQFLKEADIMRALKNKWLVPFYGLCLSQGGQLLSVSEFEPLDALNTFLHRTRPPMKDALRFVTQIALGMSYLEKQRVVHRDLAARNVLVNTPKHCKIADFSLARALGHETDYYRTEQRGMWPIKWYAPECLYKGKFNSASDVWSFGVTAWEAVNHGAKPYPGWKGRQVLEFVESGKRLKVPPHMNREFGWVQPMLERCWNKEPSFRPTFEKLAAECSQQVPPE